MGRRKPHFDPGEEVETPVVEEQLDAFPAPEQEAPVPETSDVLLKDHTHAGVAYAAGTPVSELNLSAAALDKLKNYGVV